jgi:hypothetical protein
MILRIQNILDLPESCLVNMKITKAFFKRNFELTKAERTLLDDFSVVVNIDWIATVNPDNSNVPAFNSNTSTFEEIQIISIKTNQEGLELNNTRIIDLIQKYIPYHVFLITYSDTLTVWNTCLKRINENDNTKRVIEKCLTTEIIDINNLTENQKAFFNGVSFSQIDKTNLNTLYQSYIQQVVALNASILRGEFITRPVERTKQDVIYIEQIANLEKDIVTLTNLAKRETQLSKQVVFNTQIQHKRKKIENLKQLLRY